MSINLKDNDIVRRAMRRVARHWPVIYAKLLCLEWGETNDDGTHPDCPIPVPYGATDGHTLFLNPAGVAEMGEEGHAKGDGVGYIAFLLVHEGAHAILNHGFRLAKFANGDDANQAADYKVNEMIHLRNQEVGGKPFPLPDWVLLDTRLSAPLSTEQLYQHLRKNQPDDRPNIQPKQANPDNTSTQPGGDTDPGSSEPASECTAPATDPERADPDGGDSGDPAASADGSGGSPGGGSSGGDGDPGGTPDPSSGGDSGSGTGTDGGVADPSDNDAGGAGPDAPAPGKPGDGSGDTFVPQVPADQLADLERGIEEDNERLVLQDTIDNHQCGTDPGSSKRIVGERNAPGPQDWAAYAAQFVETRCQKGWRYPFNHGVYTATGMVAPGREGKKVGDIVVVVDSSGSIGRGAWEKFFDLCQFVLDDIQPEHLHLVSCDAQVREHIVLEPGEEVPRTMAGGGGTSFRAAFEWIDREDIDPLLVIYFTDGWAYDHKEMNEPHYPVLWLSYQKKRDHFPWGEFAEITTT